MTIKHANIIALGIILLVVLFILFSQPQRDECDIHIENFRKVLKADLYVQNLKTTQLPPRIKGAVSNCRNGNNSGACLDVHEIMIRFFDSLNRVPQSCFYKFENDSNVTGALITVMKLYIAIAWGEGPPERLSQVGAETWLEYQDYALYCRTKKSFIQLFGQEKFSQIEAGLVSDLPGEFPILKDNKCLNCEHRKSALQVMGFSEVKKRSLLGINCSRF